MGVPKRLSGITQTFLMASLLKPNTKDTKNTYNKFLIMKAEGRKLSKEDSFDMNEAIRDILGHQRWFDIKPHHGSGLLLIEVDQKQTHDKLLSIKKVLGIPVSVSPHSTLNSSKGTIFCDNIHKHTEDQIQAKLEDQGVTHVHRIKRRDGEYTFLYVLTFNTTTLPQNIKVGYMNCKVRLYIPNPRRCFKCQGYGHGQNTCSHDPVCPKCAASGRDHPSFEDCRGEQRCINCNKTDHPASSRDCPMYKLEKKIQERKVKNQLTYPTARSQIINENPGLVSQIPTIRSKPTNAQTYSSAANSATAAASSEKQALQQVIQLQQQQIQQQNLAMKQMQDQLATMMSLLKASGLIQGAINNQNSPSESSSKEASSDNNKKSKRKLSGGTTSSSNDLTPSKRGATSDGQEVNLPNLFKNVSLGGKGETSGVEVSSAVSAPSSPAPESGEDGEGSDMEISSGSPGPRPSDPPHSESSEDSSSSPAGEKGVSKSAPSQGSAPESSDTSASRGRGGEGVGGRPSGGKNNKGRPNGKSGREKIVFDK